MEIVWILFYFVDIMLGLDYLSIALASVNDTFVALMCTSAKIVYCNSFELRINNQLLLLLQ